MKELEDFYKQIQNKEKIDWTKGIFQAIGFKEFINYLKQHNNNNNNDNNNDEKSKQKEKLLLEESILELKQNTKHYAKNQLIWIKRLRNHTDLFQLNTSDISNWNETIRANAFQIVKLFLHNSEQNFETLRKLPFFLEQTKEETKEIWKKYLCEQCEKECNGLVEWESHLKSKAHKMKKRKLKKQNEKVEKKRKTDFTEEKQEKEENEEKEEE